VTYGRGFLAHAAGELDSLPAGSAIEQMLADPGDAGSSEDVRMARQVSRVCNSSTLPREVSREEHAPVPAEIQKRVWARSRGLNRRREAEAALYVSG
jgi:hypothetical protein